MKDKVIRLAHQLMSSMPASDVNELIRLLTYYNKRFLESDRLRAMEYGSNSPQDNVLEEEVRKGLFKAAESQSAYVISASSVCKCCGK